MQEESKTPKPSAQEQTNVSTQQRLPSAGQKNEKKANKKPKKEQKPTKETKADSEDELAFLDRIIEENSKCAHETCEEEVKRAYYC